ncbi:hypothetical protein Tco_1076384, partial [Tanacetum coccineum]
DLIGDEESTDEDGDISVSVSLGDKIFSKGKESLESNISDSDNTGNSGKTAEKVVAFLQFKECENVNLVKSSKQGEAHDTVGHRMESDDTEVVDFSTASPQNDDDEVTLV